MIDEYTLLMGILKESDFDLWDVLERFRPEVIVSVTRNVLEKECKGAFKVKRQTQKRVPVCRVSRTTSDPRLRLIHVGKGLVEILYGGDPKLEKCEKLMILLILGEAKKLEERS